jgi:hypothetical integral membrane protein (TIGR02206 family)
MNIWDYIGKDYTGAPFELFGTAHLAALALFALLNFSLPLLRARPQAQHAFRYGLAGLLLVNEAVWHAWNLYTGQWTIQTMLPLHICSVFVFLSAYMLVKRSYGIYEYAYFLGIAGALQALLTPDAGIYGFPHLRFLQTMISHGSIVTAAVYMTVVEGFRPTWGSMRRMFIGANIYMALVMVVNFAIGSNYLYVARPPDTPSLIDLLGPWPWYILALEAIGLAMSLILYLPFAVLDWRKKPLPAAA